MLLLTYDPSVKPVLPEFVPVDPSKNYTISLVSPYGNMASFLKMRAIFIMEFTNMLERCLVDESLMPMRQTGKGNYCHPAIIDDEVVYLPKAEVS